MNIQEMVLLDGGHRESEWPIEIALQLIKDPIPWLPLEESGQSQLPLFGYVASFVNGYKRYEESVAPIMKVLGENGSFENFTTQQLLDTLFFVWRRYRHIGSTLTKESELQLRKMLFIVVSRISSENPPVFIRS